MSNSGFHSHLQNMLIPTRNSREATLPTKKTTANIGQCQFGYKVFDGGSKLISLRVETTDSCCKDIDFSRIKADRPFVGGNIQKQNIKGLFKS